MSKTNADEEAFTRALDNDATVKMVCGCGHAASYATFTAFNNARLDGHLEVITDGEWDWAFATGRFRATCPQCGGRGDAASLIRQPYDAIVIETESSMPDREPFFSPAAPLSEKRAKYVELIDGADGPAVELRCGCGHLNRYDTFASFHHVTEVGDIEFTVGGDYAPYALADDNFEVECPDCGGVGEEATLYKKHGSFLVEMNIGRAAVCPTCDAYVEESGLKSGPEAPEIGWDYYECPECDARTRPESVGLEGN
jgi:hypothetical protein